MRHHLFLATSLNIAVSACANLGAVEKTPPLVTAPLAYTAPADAQFISERAQQAYATGRWDVAEGYYLQLTRLQPHSAQIWFQLGNLYAEQGRLDSAQRAYREALRRRDDAKTLHNLGLVQVKLGIGALREAEQRLAPDAATRAATRALLRTILESGLPVNQIEE